MGLTLLIVVSTNNFPVTNTAKASKLLGDENFRLAVTEAGGSENYHWPYLGQYRKLCHKRHGRIVSNDEIYTKMH